MNDLIAAIRAAIDETERIAGEAAGPGWQTDVAADSGWNSYHEHVRTHILRHDPAAILRRCAADRKILDERDEFVEDHADIVYLEDACQGCIPSELRAWDRVLELLAEGYGIEVAVP